jgi:aminoglycoside phosphotransferase family enzyme/predicted kinase
MSGHAGAIALRQAAHGAHRAASDAMSADTDLLAAARRRVADLRAWLEQREGRPVRLVETHISWILLTDAQAYKLKKPVWLPFLDYRSIDARRDACASELRLNRPLAPALYLDVAEVRASPDGPLFGGSGALLDVAVRMRRFPDGALWSEKVAAGMLTAAHVDGMVLRLVEFQRGAAIAPVGSVFGSAAVHAHTLQGLIDAIDRWPAWRAPDGSDVDWPALRTWLLRELPVLAPLWTARRDAGRVREGHGDLHLANVLELDGQPAAFDAIDFDPQLRWIDVLDDIAFLAMDLLAHGQAALAWRFVNAWLEASGDYDGLPALRYHLVGRALVRAHVGALAAAQSLPMTGGIGAAHYLALAAALARGADARLAITHGLPGSGKTWASQRLLEAAGAIRVRSDVERKRLHGLGALQSSRDFPQGIYDAASTARTYARLLEIARTGLAAGWPVIVDAAFLRQAERASFAALADELTVPYTIADCRAPGDVLRARIAHRQAGAADASEADVAVLERLRSADEPLDAAEQERAIVVEAGGPQAPELLAQRWLAAPRRTR